MIILSSLHGGHQKDEDNITWVIKHFVIDSYLKVIAETATCNAETTEWEVFEKRSSSQLAVDLLGVKANLRMQDYIYVLAPCNPVKSKHWFLFAQAKVQIVIMDSLQGSSVKPTHKVAV